MDKCPCYCMSQDKKSKKKTGGTFLGQEYDNCTDHVFDYILISE